MAFHNISFIPYYPGCGEPDYSIQYAVTLGEERYVPRYIPHVIDIGSGGGCIYDRRDRIIL